MKTYTEVAEAVFRIGEQRIQARKRRRKRLGLLGGAGCAAVLTAAVLIGLWRGNASRVYDIRPSSYGELPLVSVGDTGVYGYDPTNMRLVSGAADYILAARVSETVGTAYERHNTPYTVYRVENLWNLKGAITMDGPVEIWIYGGVTRDKKRIEYLWPLPAEGAVYVMYLECANNKRLYINQAYPLYGLDDGDVPAALSDPAHPAYERLRETVWAYENEDTSYAPAVKNVSPYDTAATETAAP